MALLPGSPAIGAGTGGTGIPTTDQRGSAGCGARRHRRLPEPGLHAHARRRQHAADGGVGTAFANPLAVTVTANNTGSSQPVDGGVVTFTAPAAGASASLSAATATIAGGQAASPPRPTRVGSYTVTASAAGVATGQFGLTNTGRSLVVNTTRTWSSSSGELDQPARGDRQRRC